MSNANTRALRLAVPLTTLIAAAAPGAADANELDVAAALSAGQSSEPDDTVGFAELRASYALKPWLAVGLRLRAGQTNADVDERSASSVTAHADLSKTLSWGRLYTRLGFIHQHEQPMESVRADPIESALGVHDDIGHRSGVSAAAGLTVPVMTRARDELYLGFELSTDVFIDSAGPRSYYIAGIGFGWRRDLGAAPTPKSL